MIEKDTCPNCGKLELEKMHIDAEFAWLMPTGCEAWGCCNCGQAFFKKIEKES